MFIRSLLVTAVVSIILPVATANAANTETCKASWYGKAFHMKNLMANGKLFNMYDPTMVAHKKLPLGTEIRITNLANGRSIIATVTDRGPFIPGRCVDVSMAGAKVLGFIKAGTARVKVDVVS